MRDRAALADLADADLAVADVLQRRTQRFLLRQRGCCGSADQDAVHRDLIDRRGDAPLRRLDLDRQVAGQPLAAAFVLAFFLLEQHRGAGA